MSRSLPQSTAELVMQVTEAIHANGEADSQFVQQFCDLSARQADNALELATDLGLLIKTTSKFKPGNPIVSFVATPDDRRKAALLRVVLESYEPFVVFRNRLAATKSADTAAQQTRVKLDIAEHREDVKDTLISLGTYTNALISLGGGTYTSSDGALDNQLSALADAASDLASAESVIRQHIGSQADKVNRGEVMIPLANALLKAAASRPRDAVTGAACAVESFLARLAERLQVRMAGANGISQKLEAFRVGNHLPKKLVEAAKYLAQVRNAADHGVDVDPEVGAVWEIQQSTGVEYVRVACSFIAAALERETGGRFII